MLSGIEIIVVAPKQYEGMSRTLSHEISKHPGCNGASWSIAQFKDNEFKLGGNRYVILIGNPDENEIAKDFIPLVSIIQNRAGACFGYDGSKAVVYGEGLLEQEESFKEVLSNLSAVAGAAAASATSVSVGTSLAAGLLTIPGWLITIPSIIVGLPLYLYWRRTARQKKLRGEQTKAALTLFLAQYFDTWVGIKKGPEKER